MSKFIPQIEKGTIGEFIDGYAILSQSIFFPRTKDWDAYSEPVINIINEEYERQLSSAYDAISIIRSKSKHYYRIKSGNNVGLLSSTLQILLHVDYSTISVDINSDIIRVSKNLFSSETTLVQYLDSSASVLRELHNDLFTPPEFGIDRHTAGERDLNKTFPLYYNDYCIITCNGSKGIMDLEGKYAIPPIYENLEIINDKYVIACLDSKYGIISFKESILIDFSFDLMQKIGNNYVAVKNGINECVINVLFPRKLDFKEFKYFQTEKIVYVEYGSIKYNNYVFHSEDAILVSIKMENEKIKYGYVDYDGNILIPITYDDLCEFENGIAIANKNNKACLINKNNQLINQLYFDSIKKTKCSYYVTLRNDRYGLLNPDGSVLLQSKYTKIEFQEGISASCFEVELNSLYNYMELNGEWRVEEWYDRNEQSEETYTRKELDDMYRDAFDGFDDAIWNID